MTYPDETTADERALLSTVTQLRLTGDIKPLIALMRDGHDGPQRARNALTILAELDPELLAQVALDALIDLHADDPDTARPTRRIEPDST